MTKPPCWILCSRRTGSTYLCELLNNSKKFIAFKKNKAFGEWLRFYKSPEELIKRPPRNLKAIDHQFFDLVKKSIKLNDLLNLLPDIKLIYLKRRDKIRHAVSIYIAKQIQKWHIYNETMLIAHKSIPITIDKKKLLNCYKEVTKPRKWDKFLGDYPVYDIYYEDLCANTTYELRKILKLLHVIAPYPRRIVEETNKTIFRTAHPITEDCVKVLQTSI